MTKSNRTQIAMVTEDAIGVVPGSTPYQEGRPKPNTIASKEPWQTVAAEFGTWEFSRFCDEPPDFDECIGDIGDWTKAEPVFREIARLRGLLGLR